MNGAAYNLFLLLGIILAIRFWWNRFQSDDRLTIIFVAAICGAFIGAKILYVISEGFLYSGRPDFIRQLLTGKSVLGGLIGGYVAVECAKKLLGYTNSTGDYFASVVPLSLAIGRLGCLAYGCCLGAECPPDRWYAMIDSQGVPRWPAVPLEILFNLAAAGVFFILRQRKMQVGQHFNIYLISYGAFRFFHEYLRDTPKVFLALSGYQIAALFLIVLGAVKYCGTMSTWVATNAGLNKVTK